MRRGWPVVLLLAVPTVASAQQAETIEYYGTDAIGSIRIVWDASGNVTERQDFTPFGEPVLQQGTAIPKEGFGGNESDAETNQDYFHARMFEARTGRFTRTDPIEDGVGEPQAWNRYAYAFNNPLSFSDVGGLDVNCPDQPDFCSGVIAYGVGGGNELDQWNDGLWGQVALSFIPDFPTATSNPDNTGGTGAAATTTTTTTTAPSDPAPPSGPPPSGPPPSGPPPASPTSPSPHATRDWLQCANSVAQSYSIAGLTGATGFWGQSLLGNDVASIAGMFTGPDRAANVGSVALSNPTPVNFATLGGTLAADAVRWGPDHTELGYTGAGEAFAKGFTQTTLLERLTAAGVTGVVFSAQMIKLGLDVGTYAGSLLACSAK